MLVAAGVVGLTFGGWAFAAQEGTEPRKSDGDPAEACLAMMQGQGATAEGRQAMERFMQSEKMLEAMTGMMAMARSMGGGDPMKGMVRMMEMMGSMDGMMGPAAPHGTTPQQPGR
jgi:hypothetical protein